MNNMLDMLQHKKVCPITSAAITSALMNHAIDEEYRSIVLQDEEAVVELGFCLGGNGDCAWWDDSRQCCGVIPK